MMIVCLILMQECRLGRLRSDLKDQLSSPRYILTLKPQR